MTALVGDVQQWRDGRWRTVLTAAGTPVTDRRAYQRAGREEGVLFGFDGASTGPGAFSVLYPDGRIGVVGYDHTDHIHWGPP